MNGSLNHGRHNAAAAKEYFWGCKLTKDKPEETWAPARKEDEEEEDDDDFVQETLFLRQAVLDVGAVKGERNVIEVKTKTFQGKSETAITIASLTLGTNDMCSLDVNFNHDIPATFKLVEGNGPVCLVGQHLVEFADDYDDLDMTEGDLSEANESFKKTMAIKRKASNSLSNKNKRGKIDDKVDNGADGDDDEDEDDEDDEDPESEEEDDDASDFDEEEMEEDSPKKKKKQAVKNGKPKAKKNGATPEAAKKTKAAALAKKPAAKKSSKKAAK